MLTNNSLDSQNDEHLFKKYRIVGGDAVGINQYPWIVAMLEQSQENYYDPVLDYRCTGTLIAPNVVISAAHCEGKVDYVQIGRYNLLELESSYETFKIKQSFMHPSNLVQGLQSLPLDIALYVLDGNSSAATIALNRNFSLPYPDETLAVIGYGKTNVSDKLFSPIPRQAEVQYIAISDCQSRYVNETIGISTICALGNGMDACEGDSGGPLIQKGYTIDGSTDILMGTVSWGYICASPFYPGVYARISSGIEWIDDTVCNGLSPSSCTGGILMATTLSSTANTPQDGRSAATPLTNKTEKGISESTIILVSASVGGAVLIAISCALLYFVYKRKKSAQNLSYQEIQTPKRIFGRF